MISVYSIGDKVWLVATVKVADPKLPTTLPVGSIILTVEQADELHDPVGYTTQLAYAANRAQRHAEAKL